MNKKVLAVWFVAYLMSSNCSFARELNALDVAAREKSRAAWNEFFSQKFASRPTEQTVRQFMDKNYRDVA